MNTFDFFVDGLDSIKIYRDEEYMLKAEFRIVKKHLIDLLDKRLGESKYKSVVKNKVNQLNQMSVRDCNEQFFSAAWHTVWGKGSTGYSYTQCIGAMGNSSGIF